MATPRIPDESIALSVSEWSELSGCSMALHAALRCESADDVEKLEMLEAVKLRLDRLISRVNERLPMPESGE